MKKKQNNTYLLRHEIFLDHRIDCIADFLDQTASRKTLLEDLIKSIMYGDNFQPSLLGNIVECFNEIKLLLADWDILSDGDIYGYIYQKLESPGSKYLKGQYFTPLPVVEHIIKNAIHDEIDTESFRFLDPACGSGQFLIFAFKRLLEIYRKRNIPDKVSVSNIISKNLFGIDIDSFAVEIAKVNLSKISGIDVNQINIWNNDFLILSIDGSLRAFTDVSPDQ